MISPSHFEVSLLNLCLQIARSFAGGVEEFVKTAEASIIKSFDDLNIHISTKLSPGTLTHFAQACADAGPDFVGKSFTEIFTQFLLDVGAPCPLLFESMKNRFSPEINLDRISSPVFRMELLCWSATGAHRVLREGDSLQVSHRFRNTFFNTNDMCT